MSNSENDSLELLIRKTLWVNHNCPLSFKYGDDGELQCNNIGKHPPIDFLRDSQEQIFNKIYNSKEGDSNNV